MFLLRKYVYLGVGGEGDDEDLGEVKISPSGHPFASAFKLICNVLMIKYVYEIRCFAHCYLQPKCQR